MFDDMKMDFNLTDGSSLQRELKDISRKGIQANRQQLKEDMCAQFADEREWIREYVVNAYDAQAKRCWISGREDRHTLTIIVEDDGHGMDREGIIDFNTIYRSIKQDESERAVGRHGIGKLSVAAIPGQSGFVMVTSTGTECWRMEAGSLLNNAPIKAEKVEPVPSRGTRFEITFTKRCDLRTELQRLSEILYKYVRYLPISIVVAEPGQRGSEEKECQRLIEGTWADTSEPFSRSYSFTADSSRYEAVLSLGLASQSIYQNRVLISDRYNLVSNNSEKTQLVPNLKIRVDSPDFELPFGRHCLSNEDILYPLRQHMRDKIIPQYFIELAGHYSSNSLYDSGASPAHVESIAISLISEYGDEDRSWGKLPVFRVKNGHRLSYDELCRIAENKGKLYLEAKNMSGFDYSAYDAPVLSNRQPQGGLKLLTSSFSDVLINLGLYSTVMEAQSGQSIRPGSTEDNFRKFLEFHPDVVMGALESGGDNSRSEEEELSEDDIDRIEGVCNEALQGENELAEINWKVSYLVERDGKTPNRVRAFMQVNDTVIINLNHPEIQDLLKMSESAPALAGHWALAMCLSGDNQILPHLAPDTKEWLIRQDGLAKCVSPEAIICSAENREDKSEDEDDRSWREFLLDSDDEYFMD